MQSKHFVLLLTSHLKQLVPHETHTLILRLNPRGQVVQLLLEVHDESASQVTPFRMYPPKQLKHWLSELHVEQGNGQAKEQRLFVRS